MDEGSFKKLMDKTIAQGMRIPERIVSPKEYKVLEKLASEGKLDVSGYPKAEFWDEYVELMGNSKTPRLTED